MAEIRRVCRLAWDYPSHGESTYGLQPVFVNLSEEQARQGYEVHVVSRRRTGQLPEETHNGVRIHRVPPPFNVNGLLRTRELVEGDPETVIHAHATCGIFMAPLGWARASRFVSHAHGTSRSHRVSIKYRSGRITMDYSQMGITYEMMRERVLWSAASKILTVSRILADDIIDTYHADPRKIRVVYNGVDTALFRRAEGGAVPAPLEALQGKRIILYVGHFGMRKGVFFLIRAMKSILKEVPDAHLLCIGGVPAWLKEPDPWAILKGEIRRQGVEDQVTLLDKVKNRELVSYYSAASVFALPSYYESFSKVTLEAMSCSLPVVATNMGGLPEMVTEGGTGLLVGYGSVAALSSALVRVLTDRAEARQMGAKGREKVERMFTWRGVVERVSEAYKEF